MSMSVDGSASSHSSSSSDIDSDSESEADLVDNRIEARNSRASSGAAHRRNPLPTAPFVPCTRLSRFDWVKQHCCNPRVELELSPGTTLQDVAELSSSTALGGKRALAAAAKTPSPDAPEPPRILDRMAGPAKHGLRIYWLSRCVFLARGYCSEHLGGNSNHRLARILHIETRVKVEGSTWTAWLEYSVYASSTIIPDELIAESVAAVDWVLALLVDRTRCQTMKIKTGSCSSVRRPIPPPPCTPSLGALQKVVSASRPADVGPRDVWFDYHGLSDDQWRDLYKAFHPKTRLIVNKELANAENNCFVGLLEAIRHGRGPRRLRVECDDQYAGEQLSDLGMALSGGGSSVKDLDLVDSGDRMDREVAFSALLASLATPRTGLEKLEVVYFSKMTEKWEAAWNVVATNPDLFTVRISHNPAPLAPRRADGPGPEFDPLRAVENVARSSRRLQYISMWHEPGINSRDYVKRVVPLVESNRIRWLTRAIRDGRDASWRARLFSFSLIRLCGRCRTSPVAIDTHSNRRRRRGKKAARRAAMTVTATRSLSMVAHLLRGNPDLLESCCRVSDVLTRQWNDHANAIAFHQAHVANLERRMVESGVEVPVKAATASSSDVAFPAAGG